MAVLLRTGSAMICDNVILILLMRNDPKELEASMFCKRPHCFDRVNKSGSIIELRMSGQDAITC
jgi:hypothetical protein